MNTPQLIRQFTADKKKLSIMIALLAVGMLLWGRLLLKQPPKTAIANPGGAVAQAAGASGTNNSRAGAATPAVATTKVVHAELPEALDHDPFRVDPAPYARVPRPDPPPAPALTVETAGETKSSGDRADERERVNAVRRAASGLDLQSTVDGEPTRAVISGQVLRPGDRINGLTLRRVLPRQVVLEKDGVEVRLEM